MAKIKMGNVNIYSYLNISAILKVHFRGYYALALTLNA